MLPLAHFYLLQAPGMDQDEPFALDKGMEQLRSLRRGSKNHDPAGIMTQIKGFAKVSTQVHVEETLFLHSPDSDSSLPISLCQVVLRPFTTTYIVAIRRRLELR